MAVPSYADQSAAPSADQELRDTVRVLGAVVTELAERVELLEARQALAEAGKL